MYNIDGFLEFCHRNNNTKALWFGAVALGNGEQVTPVIDEYCDFIREHYKSPDFLQDINAFDKWSVNVFTKQEHLSKTTQNRGDTPSSPSLMNTLRMSLFGGIS